MRHFPPSELRDGAVQSGATANSGMGQIGVAGSAGFDGPHLGLNGILLFLELDIVGEQEFLPRPGAHKNEQQTLCL